MFDYYLKMVAQFVNDMRKQKLRCFLTMSGITWGTMSVILLLSLGESFRDAAMKSMTGMGNNILILGGGRTTLPYAGMPPGRPIRLRENTLELMARNIPEIDGISPEIQKSVTLSIGKKRQRYDCVGVYPVYCDLRNLLPRKGGRFIDPRDIEEKRRVIFIGTDIRDTFFDSAENPVGKTIMVNEVPFQVIGVMEDKIQNSSYMTQDKNLSFIPFSTCREMTGATTIDRLVFRGASVTVTPDMKRKTIELLGRNLGFDPEDKDAIWIWDTSEMSRFFFVFFLGFQTFLLMGGLFTLIVGGIGVANIMYVTIRERRREIGIRSALGATPRLILAQFMLESFLIMAIGGALGVAVSWVIVTILGSPALSGLQTFLGKPAIDLHVALISASLLALIGFAAGWSPAKAASEMDPVRALEF
jgi:putative ABC transport system permease protein